MLEIILTFLSTIKSVQALAAIHIVHEHNVVRFSLSNGVIATRRRGNEAMMELVVLETCLPVVPFYLL
jgi:hypothetical protein